MDELRRAWSSTGLVELLGEDLTAVVRTHLAARGYLRATAVVEVSQPEADRIVAAITVEPGGRTTERRIAFSGNHRLDNETLQSGLAMSGLEDSAWLEPAPLIAWLQDAYATHGFMAARATAGALVFEGSRATMPVAITEGALARVSTLDMSGVDGAAQAGALKAAGLAVGSPFVSGGETAARSAIARHFRDLGYRDAVVESSADVDAAGGQVDLAFTVSTGPRYVVRSVRTTGVQSTRGDLVEQATELTPGGPASPAAVETTRRQLYDIGTFRSADVSFVPTGEPDLTGTIPVDAVVSVQESKRFLLLYGFEVTNQYQSLFDQRVTSGGVAVDLRDRNFLGRGWTLGAGLRYEPNFQSGRIVASVPRFMGKAVRTNLYLNTQQENRARTDEVTFRDEQLTLTLEQRWRPWRPVEFAWGYKLDDRTFSFLEPASRQASYAFEGVLAALTGATIVDRRDNLFDAHRGWMASTTSEWGLQPLGSVLTYLRSVVRGSYYHPLGPLTLAASGSVGDLRAFSGQPPLTVLDIFFTAGGTQSVRGYRQDSLSSYNLQIGGEQVPVGGTRLVVLNGEVRSPLFWLFSAVGFVDAGNTFLGENKVALDRLAVGAGVGLRIRTPLAPLRLDLGYPLSSWTGQRSARWHFSFGQMF
jgi:outer membrane protein insertion porin family